MEGRRGVVRSRPVPVGARPALPSPSFLRALDLRLSCPSGARPARRERHRVPPAPPRVGGPPGSPNRAGCRDCEAPAGSFRKQAPPRLGRPATGHICPWAPSPPRVVPRREPLPLTQGVGVPLAHPEAEAGDTIPYVLPRVTTTTV